MQRDLQSQRRVGPPPPHTSARPSPRLCPSPPPCHVATPRWSPQQRPWRHASPLRKWSSLSRKNITPLIIQISGLWHQVEHALLGFGGIRLSERLTHVPRRLMVCSGTAAGLDACVMTFTTTIIQVRQSPSQFVSSPHGKSKTSPTAHEVSTCRLLTCAWPASVSGSTLASTSV
jgi:hypothetical protein